jgi:D-psicose/D-tagatose/L-ribulose 3-epimerase
VDAADLIGCATNALVINKIKPHGNRAKRSAMRIGASTFIWVSPFSNLTLDLIDRVKAFGFDLIEICVEDPETIDVTAIGARAKSAGLGVTICGAFGPQRDLSADDQATRAAGLVYLRRCVDFAAALSSPFVSGPMYSAVGKTRFLETPERRRQWQLAAANLREAAKYAADVGVKLAIEPLNRFETDLVNTVDQGLELVQDVGADNVGLLLDTFHMNIEEKDIPAAILRAKGHIVEFHACASDRGTPGEDHLPWPKIAAALAQAGYDGPLIIEAFTPEIREIAKAVSIWRPLAASQDHLAREGLAHLRKVFTN